MKPKPPPIAFVLFAMRSAFELSRRNWTRIIHERRGHPDAPCDLCWRSGVQRALALAERYK